MADYIDSISLGGTSHPIYAQGVIDGDKEFGSEDLVTRTSLIVAIPNTGWTGSSAPYTLTLDLTTGTYTPEGYEANRITADTKDTNAYAVKYGNSTWSQWVLQKKAYDTFAVNGTIDTGQDSLILKSTKIPSTLFYISIMGV